SFQDDRPLNGTMDNPTTVNTNNASNELIETDLPEGGTELFGYDTHHGVITTTQTTAISTTWRGSVNQLDASGELTGVVDGRGVSVNSSGVATLAANAGSYTRHLSYNTQGDQTSASTAPITTTLNGVTTASTPVTTTFGYDGDGDQTSVTSANGNTTTYGYTALGWTTGVTSTLNGVTTPQTITHDALGRVSGVQSGSSTQSFGYDGNGNLTQAVTNGSTTTYPYNNSIAPNEVQTVSTA